MEEYPNTYRNKNEETIRDYILLILSLNFKVSVMWLKHLIEMEKTDILLKYNNENIFIAECKIGLRHGFLKGTDLSIYSRNYFQEVANILNSKLKKSLHGLSSKEVFIQMFNF